jgi:hypothetical protein
VDQAVEVTLGTAVADAIRHLDRAGVLYMVTGSLASSYYGEPRATRDVDIVVDPDLNGLARLVDALQEDGYYVDRGVAFEALRGRTQFNAIGPEAMKVDLIVRKDRAFSIEEFGRRRPADLLGVPAFIPTLEDIVIAKLEWAAAAESERQLRDVTSMLAVSGGEIDEEYVVRWVETLGLHDLWRVVRRE